MPCRNEESLNLGAFFRYQCQFLSLRQKFSHFRVCLQTINSDIHGFLIRNPFVRNLYWDCQMAIIKNLSILKVKKLIIFFFRFLIIILKIQ